MVRRVFVEKKKGFDLEAQRMYRDLKENLRIAGLSGVRLINRYDVEGISDEEYESAKRTIFSEPPVEEVFDETISIDEKDKIVAIEYLPGQYDQRADSASQCIQILTHGERPNVKVAKLIVLQGDVSQEEYEKVKKYLINPVECQEASLEKPSTLDVEVTVPEDVKVLKGFVNMSREELKAFADSMGLAMSLEDLEF